MAIRSNERSSIRNRISRRLSAGVFLILLTAGWVLDRVIEERLEAEFDGQLLAKARALATLTKEEPGPPSTYELDFADEVMPEFERPTSPDYFEVWVERDTVLERSRSLAGRDLQRRSGMPAAAELSNVVLPDGRPGRQVQLGFVPQPADDEEGMEPDHVSPADFTATVVVAAGRAPLDTSLVAVRTAAAAAGIGILALLLLLGWWSLSAGFRPLEAIALQVGRVEARSLGRRIELPEMPREIAPLVDHLNLLLARLEEAFERERRLSSDLAHELRTPVAELRTLAEIGAAWPEDRQAVEAFFTDVMEISRSMEQTVELLLTLARAEAGIVVVAAEPFDFARRVAELWYRLEPRARQRGLSFRLELPASCEILSDPVMLEHVVLNLLDNAVSHAPAGDHLEIRLKESPSLVVFAVVNSAPQLEAADLPRLFERCWRKDAARSGNHAGLGLTLVAELARMLEIGLEADLDRGRLSLALRFPRAGGIREQPWPAS
jgi:signal transduction histidine kinase